MLTRVALACLFSGTIALSFSVNATVQPGKAYASAVTSAAKNSPNDASHPILCLPFNALPLIQMTPSGELGDSYEQLTTPCETLSGLHILLCDDEKVTLKVTSVLLDRLGVSYSTASNGREALSATFNDDFDAILMDINMPEMDGIAFLKNYRQRGGNSPVIAFTANALPDDIQRYFSLGFSEVLVKPVSLEALQQCLQPHLANTNAQPGGIPTLIMLVSSRGDECAVHAIVDYQLPQGHRSSHTPPSAFSGRRSRRESTGCRSST